MIILITKIVEQSVKKNPKSDWLGYNKNVEKFLKSLTKDWNKVDKKQLTMNGPPAWKWQNDSVKKLQKAIK